MIYVPFGPSGPPESPGPPGTSWTARMAAVLYHQDGDRGRERDPEIHRVSVDLCDLHHPSLNLFQFL